MAGRNEVEVNVDFAELQNRADRLRHQAEGIVFKTKKDLEKAAEESGLPVAFTLNVAMKFPQKESKSKVESKTP